MKRYKLDIADALVVFLYGLAFCVVFIGVFYGE